jgi:hypothetical protein
MPETSLLPDFAARWRYSFARPIGHAGLRLEYLRLTAKYICHSAAKKLYFWKSPL